MTSFSVGKVKDVGEKEALSSFIGVNVGENFKTPRFLDWVKKSNSRRPDFTYYYKDYPEYLGANGLPATLVDDDAYYILSVREGGDDLGSLDCALTIIYENCTILSAFGDTDYVDVSPGRATCNYAYANRSGTLSFNVLPTAAEHSISIVPTDRLADWEAGKLFEPAAKACTDQFAGVRFMTWNEVNNFDVATFEDLSKETANVWDDVPISVCAKYVAETPILHDALGNPQPQIGWFCIPHLFDDAQTRLWAQELLAHYPAGRTCIVEYSNELWNIQFSQAKWAQAQAKALWGTDETAAFFSYYAMISTLRMKVVREEFAAAGRLRDLRTVLGVHTARTTEGDTMAVAPFWRDNDTGDYIPPHEMHDFFAVTGYFDNGDDIFLNRAHEILDDLEANGQASAAALTNSIMAEDLPILKSRYESWALTAKRYGMRLIMYEGQQHAAASAYRFGTKNSPWWNSECETNADFTDFIPGEWIEVGKPEYLCKVISTDQPRMFVGTAMSISSASHLLGHTSNASSLVWGMTRETDMSGPVTDYIEGEKLVISSNGFEKDLLAIENGRLVIGTSDEIAVGDTLTGKTSGATQQVTAFWHVAVVQNAAFTVGETVTATNAAGGETTAITVLAVDGDRVSVSATKIDDITYVNAGTVLTGQTSGAVQLVTNWTHQFMPDHLIELTKAVIWSDEQAALQDQARDIWDGTDGTTYYNQFVDFSNFSAAGNWGTMLWPGHPWTQLMDALIAWQAANPRHFRI